MSDRRCPCYTKALLYAALLVPAVSAAAADQPMHDPLRPPDYRAAPVTRKAEPFDASAWSLVSTLVSGTRRVAIINGRSVRPGDRVGGARVLRIDHGAVRLDYRGRQFTIRGGTPTVRHRERRGEQAE